MEPTEDHLNKENCEKDQMQESGTDAPSSLKFEGKKLNVPVSSLSASENEDNDENVSCKRTRRDESYRNEIKTAVQDACKSNEKDLMDEQFSLPTLKIQPVLGGRPLSFPVHPRLTLIDLKDFILFTLNIPHPQQILTFNSEESNSGKISILSTYSENTLLCSIPGLIDELTGRCAPVSLSFKISSGLDFSIQPSDLDYESNENSSDIESTSFFEINNEDQSNSKISALAASIASIIPLPPGVEKSARMFFRSLSKSSPTNSNLPTLWEIYFPDSGIKMMVTALINSVGETGDEKNSDDNVLLENKKIIEKTICAPNLVITPPPSDSTTIAAITSNSNTATPLSTVMKDTKTTSDPKNYCEKCRIKCRPALRFICKCNKTFCQSHRYPDQHDCTYDHRAHGIASIQANNPKVVKDKIGNF